MALARSDMIPSWSASRGARAFTLVELLVAATASTLVLVGICGIYLSTARDWESQQGVAGALTTTTTACAKLTDYISQSCGVQIVTRFTTGDSIIVNLPLDKVYTNVYAPIWNGGGFEYRSGSWIGFYLSDATGNPSVNGTILWAATVDMTHNPPVATPDSSWSMYYGSQKGKVAPIKTLAFTLDQTGECPAVTVTVTTQYKSGRTTAQVTRSKTICLRNYISLGASPPD